MQESSGSVTAFSPQPAGGGLLARIGLRKVFEQVDLYLLTLMVLVVVINLPYWNSQFMLGHDTKNTYLVFHYFYNHLVWYTELPNWLPFGEYGYNALFYQLCDFSPCTYLAGLLGWVLRVRDTLILFKLSAFGDQLVFLLGLHLLTRRLYKRRLTSFLVCLMGVSSVVWTSQIYWCLRQYYLIPLVLYFYHRFFVDRTSWSFWAGILSLLFALVGGLPYWAPIYVFLFIVITVILLPSHWRSFGCLLRPSLRDLVLMALIVACAAAAGYVILTCLGGLHNYAEGRSMGDMKTHLRTYLTYITPVWGQLHAFLDGTYPDWTIHPGDLNLYVGLLSIIGFAVALVRVKDVWFYSLAGGMIALAMLADSGAFSWLLYWVMPGLNKFRHLGLLLEIVKVLLLLAGGFGVDQILGILEDRERLSFHFRPVLFLSLLATLCLILDMLVSSQAYRQEAWSSPMVLAQMLPQGGEWVVVRLAVWALTLASVFVISRSRRLTKLLPVAALQWFIVFACLVDMVSFQGYNWTNRRTGVYAGRLELEPMVYSETRTMAPSVEIVNKNNIIMSSPAGAYLAFYANVLQYDPCVPQGRVDIFPRGVHELVTARGAQPQQWTITETFLPFNDPKLLTVMGCSAPKLRFISQAEYGSTDIEITNKIAISTDLDTTVILKGVYGQQPTSTGTPDLSAMAYRPTFFNANRLDLDVAVKPGLSGWLVYADAFDPHWKVFVNGKEKNIIEAYRAFKAVAIEGGESKVSFRYENTPQKYAMGLLVMIGILLASCCIAGLGWQLFNDRREVSVS